MSAALALLLTGALAACTGSSDPDDEADTKPGDPTATTSTAPPGKHRTLPEACGTVSVAMLKDLLPGAAAEEEASDDGSGGDDPSPSPYEGEASVTYDTDRRVGCRWKSATTLGTRHLTIDFERVVSYDPAVSDDEQAGLLYERKATKADIPLTTPSPEESDDTSGETGDSEGADSPESSESPDGSGEKSKGEKEKDGAKESAKGKKKGDAEGDGASADETDATQDGTEEQLSPRTLDGIGDAAYINDKLDTEDSGVHRDITLVFRTANVIATVEYDQWVTDKHRIPGSRELQDKAQELSEQLVGRFEEE
ncbi:hypothetical protein [Streptomyces sp. NPDC048172]|uniref:hypothetical protein n=1 Tax=Streptomyces sp. NPDC048172 TaxID=3365505 RepID=UPI0037157374